MASNLDRLAEKAGAKPVVTFGEDGVTVTLHASNAVYTATATDAPTAAKTILDALGG